MNKQWSSQELKLLKNLSEAFQGKRWKKISREFQAQGFRRTEYECRNKWVNYLNPQIDHRQWTNQQLQILYEEYQTHKSQWALIQKALPARTQIKIRNKFYGAIRNLVRFLIKYFKVVVGSWSLISNKIRPEILQNLYGGVKEFSFVGNIVKNAIIQMEFRFDRIKFMEIIELNQQILKNANDIILQSLENLNEILEGSQKQQKSAQVEEYEQDNVNKKQRQYQSIQNISNNFTQEKRELEPIEKGSHFTPFLSESYPMPYYFYPQQHSTYTLPIPSFPYQYQFSPNYWSNNGFRGNQ